jgi:hypothetical protein
VKPAAARFLEAETPGDMCGLETILWLESSAYARGTNMKVIYRLKLGANPCTKGD